LYTTPPAEYFATAGVRQIAVTNPSPGGGTSASVPLTVTGVAPHVTGQVVVQMSARTIAADPVRSVVYAGLDSTDSAHPSAVVALDATTGAIMWTLHVTGTPQVLAVSDDGQFLYVGTVTEPQITRIALATHSADLTIPLGSSSTYGPYRANSIHVSPGHPHTIAVQRECMCNGPYSSTDVGITLYDDAVARPASSTFDGTDPPAYTYGGSSSVMYGFLGGTFYEIAIDASGATTRTVLNDPTAEGATGPEVLYLGGTLYTTGGYIYDPALRKSLPSIPEFTIFPFTIAASQDGHLLYGFGGSPIPLHAYNLTRSMLAGAVAIPGLMNRATNLVSWGTDGLAFISEDPVTAKGSVFLVRVDFQ
jgi:hypothetical protein